MDTANIIKLVILIILLILSGFFSSAETALTTLNRIKLNLAASSGDKKAILLVKITSNSSKMLSAILIGNNIVNLSASALATILAQNIWGNKYVSFATGILTFLVLIFGEIIPKTVASLYPEKIAYLYTYIINVLMIILTPFIFVVDKISYVLLMCLGIDTNKKRDIITEAELRGIVSASTKHGIIEDSEEDIINNVFDLSDALAKDIMVPRIDICSTSVDTPMSDFYDLVRDNKYTRIPIYENTIDNIIGFVNIKDVFFDIINKENKKKRKKENLRDYIRATIYTFEQKNLYELLDEMMEQSIPLAVVLDSHSAVAGIISLEDILEELVGEIRDEFDSDEVDTIRKADKSHYIVSGITRIEDFNDFFNTKITSDDYDSISGIILEKLDRIPSIGDTIEIEDLTIKVTKLDKQRIDTLIVYKTKSKQKEDWYETFN